MDKKLKRIYCLELTGVISTALRPTSSEISELTITKKQMKVTRNLTNIRSRSVH